MSLTGQKLIHANSSVASAVPTAGQMVQGQMFINNLDQNIFIKNSSNVVVAVASATAYAKALSSVQTVNGQSPTAGAVTVTPSQIGAFGVAPLNASFKIDTVYLPDTVLGAVEFQGTWDAATNTPTLPDPTTVKGDYYVTDTAGTQFTLAFVIGDWVISDGVAWRRVQAQNAVTSVNGEAGVVVLTATDVGAVAFTGDVMTGNLVMTDGATVTGLPTPVDPTDAASKDYVDTAISGVPQGTVTSVSGASNTAAMTLTGGPITDSGTLTVDFYDVAKNKFFMGPITGADAEPAFRVIDSADLANVVLDEGSF